MPDVSIGSILPLCLCGTNCQRHVLSLDHLHSGQCFPWPTVSAITLFCRIFHPAGSLVPCPLYQMFNSFLLICTWHPASHNWTNDTNECPFIPGTMWPIRANNGSCGISSSQIWLEWSDAPLGILTWDIDYICICGEKVAGGARIHNCK